MSEKDPLIKSQDHAHRELFKRLSRECSDFTTTAVIDAAANLVVNAIRQSRGTRKAAEDDFDALFGRMKSILVEHYDSLGRKRGIFPYDQLIQMEHTDFSKKRPN